MTPYSDIDLGQRWLREWIVACRHQAIIRTNVDLSSIRPSEIHLRAILQKISEPPIITISLKIIYLKFHSNLPGVNLLNIVASVSNYIPYYCVDMFPNASNSMLVHLILVCDLALGDAPSSRMLEAAQHTGFLVRASRMHDTYLPVQLCLTIWSTLNELWLCMNTSLACRKW